MSAVTLNYPWVLLGFTIFIPLLLLDFSSSRRKQIQENLPKHLRMRLGVSRILFRVFLACIIAALAGPSWGTGPAAFTGEILRAADVVIALDVSRSMEIRDGGSSASDTAGISRLERGLAIVREAAAAAPGMRLGVAVSRNRGIVAVPLTWDLDAALVFLDAASPSLTGRGTNLESLVDAAAGAFQPSHPSTRLILLVSDGEETSGSLSAALRRCKQDDIAVSAVAVGSDEGALLDGGILSRRDSRALRAAAGQTGGVYIDGNSEDASRALARYLRSFGPGAEGRGESQTERAPRWFLFAILAIIAFGASKLCLLRLGSGE